MFEKVMNYIREFLKNTPNDIYEFSIILEDALVDDYDEMHNEQLRFFLMKRRIFVLLQNRV